MMNHRDDRKISLKRKFLIGTKSPSDCDILFTFSRYKAELTIGNLTLSLTQRKEVKILKFNPFRNKKVLLKKRF